jgi:hypothetical protein
VSAGASAAVLLWLAFAVLVAAVLWIVLGACGLASPGGRPMLVFCPDEVAAREADPALAAERERQRALQGRVRDLEIALLARPYCAAPTPASIEDAIRQGDVQALEGCWELDSDMVMEVIETGEPIAVRSWDVCFSGDGSGDQTLVLTEGSRCVGRVDASFPDQATFVMRDAAKLRCRGGRLGYSLASTTTCEVAADGTAQCVRRDQDNPENASPVTMRRTGR